MFAEYMSDWLLHSDGTLKMVEIVHTKYTCCFQYMRNIKFASDLLKSNLSSILYVRNAILP